MIICLTTTQRLCVLALISLLYPAILIGGALDAEYLAAYRATREEVDKNALVHVLLRSTRAPMTKAQEERWTLALLNPEEHAEWAVQRIEAEVDLEWMIAAAIVGQLEGKKRHLLSYLPPGRANERSMAHFAGNPRLHLAHNLLSWVNNPSTNYPLLGAYGADAQGRLFDALIKGTPLQEDLEKLAGLAEEFISRAEADRAYSSNIDSDSMITLYLHYFDDAGFVARLHHLERSIAEEQVGSVVQSNQHVLRAAFRAMHITVGNARPGTAIHEWVIEQSNFVDCEAQAEASIRPLMVAILAFSCDERIVATVESILRGQQTYRWSPEQIISAVEFAQRWEDCPEAKNSYEEILRSYVQRRHAQAGYAEEFLALLAGR